MIARGNTRVILQKVGEIQDMVSMALANHHNDQDHWAHGKITKSLEEALSLCIEITGMYDPIQSK